MPNLVILWRTVEWPFDTTLTQLVTIIRNTGEKSWECMLSTPSLKLQKKTFCQTQTCLHKNGINILAIDITIDCLNLAFTTKSIWTQGHTLFQQSTLRTARIPHSQWETDGSPGDSRIQLCSITNVLTQDYDKCSFSHRFPENQSLWPTAVETEAKPKGQSWQFFQMQANKQLSQSLSHF